MRFYFFLLFSFISFVAFGQTHRTDSLKRYDEGYTIHPEVGCALANNFFAEAGIMRSKTGSKEGDALTLIGYKIACECNFDSENFIIAPKIAIEADPLFFAFRANLTDFISVDVNDLRFTPEVGLTLFGFVTLCIGDNLPLLNTRLTELENFEIFLNINFNRTYHRDFKFF